MVSAPQPTSNEDEVCFLVFVLELIFVLEHFAMRAKLRHTVMTNSLARDHSIGINQSEPALVKTAQRISSTSPFRSGDAFLRRVMRDNAEGMSANENGYCLPRSSRLQASLRPVGCAALRIFAPEYFSFCESHSTIHRSSDIFAELKRYFCGNTVHGSKSRLFVAYSANALTYFDWMIAPQCTLQVIRQD